MGHDNTETKFWMHILSIAAEKFPKPKNFTMNITFD